MIGPGEADGEVTALAVADALVGAALAEEGEAGEAELPVAQPATRTATTVATTNRAAVPSMNRAKSDLLRFATLSSVHPLRRQTPPTVAGATDVPCASTRNLHSPRWLCQVDGLTICLTRPLAPGYVPGAYEGATADVGALPPIGLREGSLRTSRRSIVSLSRTSTRSEPPANDPAASGAKRGDLPAALLEALARLDLEPLSAVDKGVPGLPGLTIGNIGASHLSVLRDVPTPAMTLRWDHVLHNIALLQRYCDENGAWLAPHGKTTMAPQIYAEQLRAGAWAITIANLPQLQVCRAFAIPRVLWANEPTTDYEIRYVAEQLRSDDEFDLYVLVDSIDGVERLADGMRRHQAGRPLKVMPEFGIQGRRCGVRTDEDFEKVVRAVVAAQPDLELAGIHGYEGIALGGLTEDGLNAVDAYLEHLAELMTRVLNWAPSSSRLIASGGGSFYFDRVTKYLGKSALPDYQLVLRSGTYVTHDSFFGDGWSPFGNTSPRNIGFGNFRAAFEIWAGVMSRPEPDLALLGMGRRDVPFDAANPTPLERATPAGEVTALGADYKIIELNDQHAYLRLPVDSPLKVGDMIGSGISHPCGAFDHSRTILTVDEDRTVTSAVRTFF